MTKQVLAKIRRRAAVISIAAVAALAAVALLTMTALLSPSEAMAWTAGTEGMGGAGVGTDGLGIGTDGTGTGGAGVGTDGADAGATDPSINPSADPNARVADTTAGVANASGLTYQDGIYRDMAEGYNDTVIVTVTVRDGRITDLSAANRSGSEPTEYMQKAIDGIREQVTAKQGIEGVDAVSGATGSSDSILAAMKGVIAQATASDAGVGGAGGTDAGGNEGTDSSAGTVGGTDGANGSMSGSASAPQSNATPRPTINPDNAEAFLGLGSATNFRTGPGKDEEGKQVYSFNIAMASALFDKKDRILSVRVDVYEISTPNYDGDSMPHFSGWPGKEGYSVYDPAKGGISGVSENTAESAAQELADWKTKRERGDAYGMNPQNEWYKQMDAYEGWMIGKTTAELRQWFDKYTTDAGRPIKADTQNEDDIKVLEGLDDKERQELADVTSMATMSLSDSHGMLLEAIEKAYANRVPVDEVEVD